MIGPIPADAGEPTGPKASAGHAPAYPRGRGGASTHSHVADAPAGLSPRTRGSRARQAGLRPCRGPIPADAGEPAWRKSRRGPSGAYPRGRGGAQIEADAARTAEGLSPRTRGSRLQRQQAGGDHGPIPADAGEPPVRIARAGLGWAYPRGRGGAGVTRQFCMRLRAYPRGRGGAVMTPLCRRGPLGLSPRTRGSLEEGVSEITDKGPIPADAGEPHLQAHQSPRCWAYPRGRGGAYVAKSNAKSCTGLSPRTRGSRQPGADEHLGAGPIPADAGEPQRFATSTGPDGAYPRGRGGANLGRGVKYSYKGLSPRTRGSPQEKHRRDEQGGPIPADAGEPRALATLLPAPGAYPRGRGGATSCAITRHCS